MVGIGPSAQGFSTGNDLQHGPRNPMRRCLIGRVEADEELLTHRTYRDELPEFLLICCNRSS
jgi:hypothetical protein